MKGYSIVSKCRMKARSTRQRKNKRVHLRLGLRNINNGAAHAANEDHAALGLALHQVASNRGSKQVGAVYIDGK